MPGSSGGKQMPQLFEIAVNPGFAPVDRCQKPQILRETAQFLIEKRQKSATEKWHASCTPQGRSSQKSEPAPMAVVTA
jgi:hypothetical protein